MSVEEAMVYLLSTEGRGMSAEALAREMTLRGLYVRRDGQAVSTSQVWAAFFRHPEMFCRDGRLIRLMAQIGIDHFRQKNVILCYFIKTICYLYMLS